MSTLDSWTEVLQVVSVPHSLLVLSVPASSLTVLLTLRPAKVDVNVWAVFSWVIYLIYNNGTQGSGRRKKRKKYVMSSGVIWKNSASTTRWGVRKGFLKDAGFFSLHAWICLHPPGNKGGAGGGHSLQRVIILNLSCVCCYFFLHEFRWKALI